MPAMIIEDLERVLDKLAPFAVAEPWDNVGLLVGHRSHEVHRVLVALDLTREVVVEAVSGDYQAVVAHHPLIFSPVSRITDADRLGIIINQLIAGEVAAFACHTNLDGAPGGLCDQLADELGLAEVHPLVRTRLAWKKLVGFVPPEAVEAVSRAVFVAGAGRMGNYRGCSFRTTGKGTFVPEEGAKPAVGSVGRSMDVDEVRWETVVPVTCLGAAVQAFIDAHPYEEPAFDVYPVEDVRVGWGQGRIGRLRTPTPLRSLVSGMCSTIGSPALGYAGNPDRLIDRVAIVTGSGGSLMEEAARVADVFITGDLRYHDAQRAADLGLSIIEAPHYQLENWALRRWMSTLAEALTKYRVQVAFSTTATTLWNQETAGEPSPRADRAGRLFQSGEQRPIGLAEDRQMVLRVDGGSRGNPGPAAIGVVVEDAEGRVLEEISARIGHTTNNVAEYQALITGLETALDRGGRYIRVMSDSELIVRQLRREYQVRDSQLKELYDLAVALVRRFKRVEIKHVPREENRAADLLVNKALDGK